MRRFGPTSVEKKIFRDFAEQITDHAKRIGTYPKGLKKTDKSVDEENKKEYTCNCTGDKTGEVNRKTKV